MKQFWEAVPDKFKRTVVIVWVISCLSGFIFMITKEDTSNNKTESTATIKHVLTDTNTRDISLKSLSAELKRLELQNNQLQKEVLQLKQQNDFITKHYLDESIKSKQSTVIETSENKLAEGTLMDSKSELMEKTEINEDSSTISKHNETNQAVLVNNHIFPEIQTQSFMPTDNINTLREAYRNPNSNHGFLENMSMQSMSLSQAEASQLIPVKNTSIRLINQPQTQVDEIEVDTALDIQLLAGAIIRGTLITGMDAPTHDLAKREPYPALLRIQKEAILPNRHHVDIRECFLIMAGFGDLSSERAYLRAETLSCILENERVVETKLDAYAVGEDGKAGVRGRLVSKQGQLVAKSMMAGFLQGLAGAFDVNPVPTIQTSDIGRSPVYQSVMSEDALYGAALKGTGKALDRIAKFYLDMAQNMFPVIEIDASREIEFVVTRGIKF